MNERKSNGMAIEAKGLVKRYSEEVLAVDRVDLSIQSNVIYALLGPNGAGKTTTISLLTTLIEPTDGFTTGICSFRVTTGTPSARNRSQ